MSILPIPLETLLHAGAVESVRREFKAAWQPPTLAQVTRTICAFANDFFNLNGGYIVLGVAEQDGVPILPPIGLAPESMDEIQQEIRGQCNRIVPVYQPLMSPEVYQGKTILVIWAPAGDTRPYQAPTGKSNERAFFIRQGSETIEAQGDLLRQLMQMTARTPFDDRINRTSHIEEISPALVRNYLADVRSDLIQADAVFNDYDIYRSLRLIAPINAHEVPRNVALLFFTQNPERYFPGARIEIAQFGDGESGDIIEEKIFRGPLHLQIRQALDYLNGQSTIFTQKVNLQAESVRYVAFPYESMEEAVVNAVYHRDYEDTPEPIKIYLYPDRMEIISYPGPVSGLTLQHFQSESALPPVPNRNRRIGEFLKDLRLAESRGTGIPKIRRKMRENGSPNPQFDFDEARSYFRVTLPAHPQYIVRHALRQSAHAWATGERQKALQILENARTRVPQSGALMAQQFNYLADTREFNTAESIFRQSIEQINLTEKHLPYLALVRALLDAGQIERANALLRDMPPLYRDEDILEAALLQKRSGNLQDAHTLFQRNYAILQNNPKAVHEFAQTKMKIASQMRISSSKAGSVRNQLNRESAELLHRAIQLAEDDVRRAWCWYDLARVLRWLKRPNAEVLAAYQKAIELLPHEPVFKQWYDHNFSKRE